MECEHGRLHQNFEFCRVDFAPLTDSRGTHSDVGRIFATTFENKWSPLVRFDIGDIVRLASDPCPCGRNFGLTLSAIEGRLKSLCMTEDGRLITHREIDNAMACVDGLEQYRLVQETLKKVRLDLISEDGQKKRVAEEGADILHEIFGKYTDIGVSEVRSLLPEKSGKFLLVKRDFPLDLIFFNQ
jgi:phenylacetate-CoA ligase